MKDTKQKLSLITISLHWLIAIATIWLLATGMTYPDLHRSLGTLILVFIIARIAWRITNGWLQAIGDTNKVEARIARISHWLLIIGSLLLPITGLLISGAGGHGLALFGVELIPENINPNDVNEVIPFNAIAADIGNNLHELISNLMILLIFIHVAGALKHHFIYKDKVLSRMIGMELPTTKTKL